MALLFRFFILLGFLLFPAFLIIESLGTKNRDEWLVSQLLFALVIFLVGRRHGYWRVIAVLLVTFLTFVSAALVISFMTQDEPFNSAFFAHLDLSSVKVAWATDQMRFIGLCAFLASGPVVGWIVTYRGKSSLDNFSVLPWWFRQLALLTICTVAVFLNYPLNAFAHHQALTSQASQRLNEEIAILQGNASPSEIKIDTSKNLVLVYLESLESTYFDEDRFPGLLPSLSRARENAIVFSDMRVYPGTGWTVAAMVSSHCGVPLLSQKDGNSILKEADNPFSNITCLSEYLKQAGYATAFLGGASLEFAGKGNFLSDNGYDTILGSQELPNSTEHKWGMYDEALVEHGKRLFDGLSQGDAPFLLTLLTLDTHHPIGTPSASCNSYAEDALIMLNAVHCTDQLISDLIEHIQASEASNDTVIALMSDHLVMTGDVKTYFDGLDRQLFFMVIDPSGLSELKAGPGTHFDVAPTLLDAVGITGAKFAFGQSLLSNSEGFAPSRNLTAQDFNSFSVESLLAD